MKSSILILFTLAAVFTLSVSGLTHAAGGGGNLKASGANVNDLASVQRGAQLFVNYCLGCHGLQYQRYGRTADDLGIPRELALDTVVFTGQKIGELMTTSMDPVQAMAWFGADCRATGGALCCSRGRN